MARSTPRIEVYDSRNTFEQLRTAADGNFPKRFGLFFWGNGMLPDRWTPAGEGSDWELSDQLAPFENVRSDLSVISGMSVRVPNRIPHGSGAAGFLSAQHGVRC